MSEREAEGLSSARNPSVRVKSGPAGITYLTLNRPEKLNALNASLRSELGIAVDECVNDQQCRVIIIRGAGRAFSAGADTSRPVGYEPLTPTADQLALEEHLRDFIALWDAPLPIIAQVHGYCIGVATILCVCCDLVVAADDAVFGWPKLPLGAGMIGPSWVWHVGVRRAKELSYQIGSQLTGVEAAALGFANASHPPAQLEAETLALAERIARTPRELLRVKKQALNAVPNQLGFREAILRGAAWDALAHTSNAVAEVRSTVAEHGLKAAIAHYAVPKDSR